jgi:hypothetical protein
MRSSNPPGAHKYTHSLQLSRSQRGNAEHLVDSFSLCRESRSLVSDGLELDGSQLSEASTVVACFDPVGDRAAKLFSSGQGLLIEDVLLQQAEEVLHCGIVCAGAHSTIEPRRL